LYTLIWMRNQELKRQEMNKNKENKEKVKKNISEKKEVKKEVKKNDSNEDIERLLLIM
ncbi:MAG: hypothetical protein RIR48_2619, partial [Bacteroidota bacterium]